MSRARLIAICSLAGAGLLPAACGDDELINLSEPKQPDAGTDAGVDAKPPPQDSGKDSGPVVRTVETRPRFGSLDLTNYMLDGELEYSGMDAMQYGWFLLESDWIATGARCHGGLRCVEVPASQYVAGVFVWPDSGSVDVSYYAKPTGSGDCQSELGALLLPLSDYPGATQPSDVSPTDPAPGADGWCHVSVNVPVPSDTGDTFWALLLAASDSASAPVLFDDAAVRVPGTGPAGPKARSAGATLLGVASRARRDFAQRPPAPPPAEPRPVWNRTARRQQPR